MSSQDRLEHVLRDIHVMISKSEAYDTDRIIVSKNDIFSLIDRLNASVYEIMDEYELTQQSRDRALRENKKEGDKIIWDASRQAEDIYAASVLYTDEALNHLHGIMEYANDTIGKLYRDFGKSMQEQQEMIRENQMELKSQLQLLTDTEKYLNLIEERNREIERERARRKGTKVLGSSTHKAIKPEIKINEAYFRKAGIPLDTEQEIIEENMEPLEDEGVIESTLKKAVEEIRQETVDEDSGTAVVDEQMQLHPQADDVSKETVVQEAVAEGVLDINYLEEDISDDNGMEMSQQQTQKKAADNNIKVNLDAEYFKRKNEGMDQPDVDMEYMIQKNVEIAEEHVNEPHHGKTSLLDKLMGKKKSF